MNRIQYYWNNEQVKNLLVPLLFTIFYILFFSPIVFSDYFFISDGLLAEFHSGIELWSYTSFSGYPSFAAPEKQTFYPLRLFFSMLPNGVGFNLFIVSAYILASCFTYGYVYQLTSHRFSSVISGLAFGLCGFMVAHLAHGSMIHAALWMPLLFWALAVLNTRNSWLWFSVGSVAVAMSILAGHPQITVYTMVFAGAYVIFLGRGAAIGWFKYIQCFCFIIVLGVGLSAIQILPMLELTSLSLRNYLSYDHFKLNTLPFNQITQFLFPYLFGNYRISILYEGGYFGAPNLTELTGYVGMLPVLLSFVILLHSPRRNIVAFWSIAILVSFILALGDETPLYRLLYEIPILNLLKAHARLFMVVAFGVAILAGLGLAGIASNEISTNKVKMAIATLFLILVMQCVWVLYDYETLQAKSLAKGFSYPKFFFNPSIWIPLIIFFLSSLSLLVYQKFTHWGFSFLVLFTLFINIGSFAFFYEWPYSRTPKTILNSSKFHQTYKKDIDKTHQRLAAIGAHPGLFAARDLKISGIETINGYGPLVLARYNKAFGVAQTGLLGPNTLLPHNQTLDLLSVKYITVKKEQTRVLKGVPWLPPSYIEFGDCHKPNTGPARVAYKFQQVINIETIHMASFLGCSRHITQGQKLLEISLISENNTYETYVLRAGIDSAEWAYFSKGVGVEWKHKPLPILEPKGNGSVFYKSISVKPQKYKQLVFGQFEPAAKLLIPAITFEYKDGLNRKFSFLHKAELRGLVKVREAPDEILYSNPKSLPRAWLVPEVVSISPREILTAIKTSSLPDGRMFVPGKIALIEEPLKFNIREVPSDASVTIVDLKESHIELKSNSSTPAFLVLSDVAYPGWEVTIDGIKSHLFTTNYALRGVMLPAGNHLIRFFYKPYSLYIGLGITILSISACLLILFLGGKGPSVRKPQQVSFQEPLHK